jgi:hypothetical protein
MGDWSKPSLTDTYANFLTYLTDRDFDASSLGYSSITNPITGQMRYLRVSDKFQEYDGAAWQDKTLALAGGGTGAATAANARTNLGLGTIATQNANNVTITGGAISGLSSLAVTGTAASSIQTAGGITAGSGAVGIVDTTGKIPAISSTYFASLSGANLTNLNASNISSGTVATARLGSGVASSATFLRGDGTWAVAGMQVLQQLDTTLTITGTGDFDLTISALTDYTKCVFIPNMSLYYGTSGIYDIKLVNSTTLRFTFRTVAGTPYTLYVRGVILG